LFECLLKNLAKANIKNEYYLRDNFFTTRDAQRGGMVLLEIINV